MATGATQEVIQEAICLLVDLHCAQSVFEAKADEHGDASQGGWPRQDLEAMRDLHDEMLEKICALCFVPKNLYLPLGDRSRGLVSQE